MEIRRKDFARNNPIDGDEPVVYNETIVVGAGENAIVEYSFDKAYKFYLHSVGGDLEPAVDSRWIIASDEEIIYNSDAPPEHVQDWAQTFFPPKIVDDVVEIIIYNNSNIDATYYISIRGWLRKRTNMD